MVTFCADAYIDDRLATASTAKQVLNRTRGIFVTQSILNIAGALDRTAAAQANLQHTECMGQFVQVPSPSHGVTDAIFA